MAPEDWRDLVGGRRLPLADVEAPGVGSGGVQPHAVEGAACDQNIGIRIARGEERKTVDAQDEEGSGEHIRERGGGVGYGGEEGALRRLPGAGVEDVSVEAVAFAEGSVMWSRHGESAIAKEHLAANVVFAAAGVAEGHTPTGIAGGRTQAQNRAGAAVDEGTVDACFFQHFPGPIDSIAFADRAEIQRDAFVQEPDGLGLLV
jgi:hypothetical protein